MSEEKELSRKIEAMLLQSIEHQGNHHARVAGLDEEGTACLKSIVHGIIQTMQISAALNSTAHDLPIQVVFVTLLEAMAEWNQSIDFIAKKPSPSNN
jgi:hypothetical protein